MRNPFRFDLAESGDSVGDVGWNLGGDQPGEQLSLHNFGWPCYEGAGRLPGYDAAISDLRDALGVVGALASPYSPYNHSSRWSPAGLPGGFIGDRRHADLRRGGRDVLPWRL